VNNNLIKCKICNRELINYKGLSNHITKFHKIKSKEYYDKYLKKENEGLCIICNRETKFETLNLGYNKFCGLKCSGKSYETKNKRKLTCISRYGVDNPSKNIEFINKQERTNIEKYGIKCSLCNNVIKKKSI
jgi:hypothetical protein